MEQNDIIYYNLNMICRKNNDSEPDQPAQFEESRDTVFLKNAQNYHFSITRFTLESNNIPILIPKIQNGQNNVNLTKYAMQMIYNDGIANISSVATYLNYVCNNKYSNYSVSSPIINQQDSPYYYIFNIQDVVDMFNDALNRCFVNLQSLKPDIICVAPTLIYNNDNTFSIYYASIFNQSIKLYLNDDLYSLFKTFQSKYISNNNINNQMVISNKILNTGMINTIDYIIEKQNYPCFQNWSPVQSIVFNSSIGVSTEFVSEPQILNSNSVFGLSTNKVENIITDIILPIDNPCDYNSFVMYNANVYREANLKVSEIRNIGLSIYWKSKFGVNYPIMLSNGNNITVKMKFEQIKK